MLAASEFCRWLRFSGLFPLLKANSNNESPPLKIDGSHLEWACEDLLSLCNEQMCRKSPEPCLTAAYLQSLHDKVDTMAGYLSRLAVAPDVTVTPFLPPETDLTDSRVVTSERNFAAPAPQGQGGIYV